MRILSRVVLLYACSWDVAFLGNHFDEATYVFYGAAEKFVSRSLLLQSLREREDEELVTTGRLVLSSV